MIPKIMFISMSSKGNNDFSSHSETGMRIFSIVKVNVTTNVLSISNNKGIVIATKSEEQIIPTIE